MKKISYWGRQNPWTARIIIVIGHVILLVSAVYMGLLSASYEWMIKPWQIMSLVVILLLAMIAYPVKGIRKGPFKHTYHRQKFIDGSLVMCSFLLIAGTSNRYANLPAAIPQEVNPLSEFMVNKPPSMEKKKIPTAKDFNRALKKLRKQARKTLRMEKKRMQANRSSDSTTGNIVLTILLAVGVFILWILILSLSCNLSCSGNEGMAWIVFIGGTGGLVLLSILAIKSIWKRRY